MDSRSSGKIIPFFLLFSTLFAVQSMLPSISRMNGLQKQLLNRTVSSIELKRFFAEVDETREWIASCDHFFVELDAFSWWSTRCQLYKPFFLINISWYREKKKDWSSFYLGYCIVSSSGFAQSLNASEEVDSFTIRGFWDRLAEASKHEMKSNEHFNPYCKTCKCFEC